MAQVVTGVMGSSPRMRGAHVRHARREPPPGIIPAYAGSTSRPRPSTAITRDHPRVCGEHFRTCIAPREREGSSPRMRGALAELQVVQHRVGIIPAYAGSTAHLLGNRIRTRDHPRVCGEHNLLAQVVTGVMGSSPRMRGAHVRHARREPPPGIIPAYAGSTRTGLESSSSRRDHPRVCGEH